MLFRSVRNVLSTAPADADPADAVSASSSEQLHAAQMALLHAQRDLALANDATEDAKSECERLTQRLQAAEQRAEEAAAARAKDPVSSDETAVSAPTSPHGFARVRSGAAVEWHPRAFGARRRFYFPRVLLVPALIFVSFFLCLSFGAALGVE